MATVNKRPPVSSLGTCPTGSSSNFSGSVNVWTKYTFEIRNACVWKLLIGEAPDVSISVPSFLSRGAPLTAPAICQCCWPLRYAMIPGFLMTPGNKLCSGAGDLSFKNHQESPSPAQFYRDIIDIQHCVSLRLYEVMIWYRYYYKMITTIRLVNTFITSPNYPFLVMRTLKVFSQQLFLITLFKKTLFCEREQGSGSACAWVGEGQRERIPSRLHVVSAEPDAGLEPVNSEITIWAETKSQKLNRQPPSCPSSQQLSSMQYAAGTILHIGYPEFTHLTSGSLYPLTNISPFLPPPSPGNHDSTPCFCEFGFFRFHE